jgi:hypothetical protein
VATMSGLAHISVALVPRSVATTLPRAPSPTPTPLPLPQLLESVLIASFTCGVTASQSMTVPYSATTTPPTRAPWK